MIWHKPHKHAKHAKHAKHGGGTELPDSRVELVCFAATRCKSIYCH